MMMGTPSCHLTLSAFTHHKALRESAGRLEGISIVGACRSRYPIITQIIELNAFKPLGVYLFHE
jgi:hypothetical protein